MVFQKKEGFVKIGKKSFNLDHFEDVYPDQKTFVDAHKDSNTFPRQLKLEDVYKKIKGMTGIANKKK